MRLRPCLQPESGLYAQPRQFSDRPLSTHDSAAGRTGRTFQRDEVLVTKLLADAGYVGGLAGKLHLSACNPSAAAPLGEPRLDDGYSVYHWSHTPLPSKITSTEGISPAALGLADQCVRALAPRERATLPTHSPSEGPYVQIGMPVELHQTTWCADRAITFMEANAGGEQPWFFSVNPFDPHHPFDPPGELSGALSGDPG